MKPVSCFSSVGFEVQEKMHLEKEHGGYGDHGEIQEQTNLNKKRAGPGVYHYAGSTSGEPGGDRRSHSQGEKERRAGRPRRTTTFCRVNVTTTYVPHTVRALLERERSRGVLYFRG